jgi:membrane protease YdiL (CAAX protease family)
VRAGSLADKGVMHTTIHTVPKQKTERARWGFYALIWFIAHTAVWISGVRLIPGSRFVPYSDLGILGTPWISQFVTPLTIVGVLQMLVLWKVQQVKPVFIESERLGGWRIWVAPVAMLAITGGAATRGFVEAGWGYYAGLLMTCMLVGMTEELTFRGTLVVWLREALYSEKTVLVASSALFGLFHLPNIFIGGDVREVLVQVVATAVLGMSFYALRRASGQLWPCMLLHAGYDAVILSTSI